MRSATTVKEATKMGLKVKAVTAGIVGAGSLFTLPLQSLATDIAANDNVHQPEVILCLLYTSPSPRDQRGSRMPSSA